MMIKYSCNQGSESEWVDRQEGGWTSSSIQWYLSSH